MAKKPIFIVNTIKRKEKKEKDNKRKLKYEKYLIKYNEEESQIIKQIESISFYFNKVL